jgi:hypothetical protein
VVEFLLVIVIVMEAVTAYETSATLYQATRPNIPEDIFIVTVMNRNLTFILISARNGNLEVPVNFLKGKRYNVRKMEEN